MIKFIGLDGKNYQLDNRQESHPLRSEAACKSKLQYECGQLLQEKLPFSVILEEVSLPGQGLTFDFFVPTLKIVLEVQGRQHDEYVQYFHKNPKGFKESKTRDANKQLLCDLNNWTFYIVYSVEELRKILDG